MIIEKELINYLNTNLTDSVKAYMEKPVSVPQEYCIAEKTNSEENNHISTAYISVYSYSSISLLRAVTINEEVYQLMKGFPSVTDISAVDFESDSNETDTRTKEYAYVSRWAITYYR